MPETASALGLLARRTKLPKGLEGSAFLVPFANTTGAAVFQRGGRTFVVFDERRPVDMAALRADPVFGQTTVQLLPNGTLLRLPVPPGVSIALFQTPQGWRIAGLAAAAKTQPIVATSVDGAMSLGAEQPSDVISVADPDTGATLLVGTQRRPGQGVATTRRTTEFVLRATGLGVVVEPLSDTIVLKVVPTGFILSGGAGGLAVSPTTADTEALMQAAHLTRRLNFSTVPAAPLMQLMKRQIADAAAAQPQARGPKRRAVAQSMIALGMSAEAESLLDVAAEQDPRQAASADVIALKAIAALLAGRPADAEGINNPRLTGTDDIALWRAVRQAMLDEGSPSAAAIFASTAPLALLYPKPIADQILPLIIETMIQGGKVTAATPLLAQRKDDHRLDYARALQQQAEGHTDQALALLDELAAGHDRFDRARAATRAVELRLASHKIDASQAADALDKLIYVWRGDQRELALRDALRGKAVTDMAAAEAEAIQAETDLTGWQAGWDVLLRGLGRPTGESPAVTGHVLSRLAELDRHHRNAESLHGRIEGMQADIAAFAGTVDDLARRLAVPAGADAFRTADLLIARRDRALALASAAGEVRRAHAEASEAADKAAARNRDANAKLAALLTLCGAVDAVEAGKRIEAARRRHDYEETRKQAQARLRDVGGGLTRATLEAELAALPREQFETERAAADAALTASRTAEQEAAVMVAELDRRYAADAAATEASEAAEAEATAAAEAGRLLDEYVLLRVASGLLGTALQRVEDNAGPTGAQRIAAAFERVTNGAWSVRTSENSKGEMLLMAYEPGSTDAAKQIDQLSEGTRDQLYLALRLVAIEAHVAVAPPLPFIADDVLQTFDDTRARAAMEALVTLSGHVQVIVLTHHPHLLAVANGLPIHVQRL